MINISENIWATPEKDKVYLELILYSGGAYSLKEIREGLLLEIFSGWQGLNYNYWEHFGSLWKWLGPIHNYFVKWKGRLKLSKIEGVFFKK